MTIDKAIKIIKCWGEETEEIEEGDFSEAVNLGIEALKAWKEFRGSGSLMDKMLLPSETEN